MKYHVKDKDVREQLIDPDRQKIFNTCTMKALYMTSDRDETTLTVKRLTRFLKGATEEEWARLKHLARYLAEQQAGRDTALGQALQQLAAVVGASGDPVCNLVRRWALLSGRLVGRQAAVCAENETRGSL